MMYTVENLEAMGSVYAQLTQLKGFNDPGNRRINGHAGCK